jgi:hypothetical protein
MLGRCTKGRRVHTLEDDVAKSPWGYLSDKMEVLRDTGSEISESSRSPSG